MRRYPGRALATGDNEPLHRLWCEVGSDNGTAFATRQRHRKSRQEVVPLQQGRRISKVVRKSRISSSIGKMMARHTEHFKDDANGKPDSTRRAIAFYFRPRVSLVDDDVRRIAFRHVSSAASLFDVTRISRVSSERTRSKCSSRFSTARLCQAAQALESDAATFTPEHRQTIPCSRRLSRRSCVYVL